MTRASAARPPSAQLAAALPSPSVLSAELVALFDQVRGQQNKVQWVQVRVAADLAGPFDCAFERACASVAAAIDAHAATYDQHPYHNRQHFCEVALTAYALCFLNRLDLDQTHHVVLAALIHDFSHDGGAHPAFVQERASVERARPLLEAAGLDPAQLRRITAMVLATDTSCGTAFMAAACTAHADGRPLALPVPAGAAELDALATDPALCQLARILCEADVLPSIGLGLGHAMQLQQCLAQEWRQPLGERDKLEFIDLVLKQGFLGEYFLPIVHATRDTLARRLNASEQR